MSLGTICLIAVGLIFMHRVFIVVASLHPRFQWLLEMPSEHRRTRRVMECAPIPEQAVYVPAKRRIHHTVGA
jgi:hypothetical protein